VANRHGAANRCVQIGHMTARDARDGGDAQGMEPWLGDRGTFLVRAVRRQPQQPSLHTVSAP
jgi:hypothetical protein